MLRPFENAWQFEEFGSKRAARSNYVFLGVSHSLVKHDKFEIIPYVFTGIIQGRWFEPVVELFQKNNLFIDFSKRGFVNQTPKRSLINKLLFHLKRWPILFKNWMELFFLK